MRLLAMLVLLQPATAFAYLDPGTGSMILQGLIAAIAVAGVTIRTYWYRIMQFFGKEPPQTGLLDDLDDDLEEESTPVSTESRTGE
ncbi:MAG: hypothetical protein AB8B48_00180 [Pseudomonadales bacterium]